MQALGRLVDEDNGALRVCDDHALAQLAQDDVAVIEATSKSVAQATESFAAARMNRGIAKALSGKNIETL